MVNFCFLFLFCIFLFCIFIFVLYLFLRGVWHVDWKWPVGSLCVFRLKCWGGHRLHRMNSTESERESERAIHSDPTSEKLSLIYFCLFRQGGLLSFLASAQAYLMFCGRFESQKSMEALAQGSSRMSCFPLCWFRKKELILNQRSVNCRGQRPRCSRFLLHLMPLSSASCWSASPPLDSPLWMYQSVKCILMHLQACVDVSRNLINVSNL